MYIPAQYRVQCSYCPLEIDTRSHRTYQRCAGWALNRPTGMGNLFLMERFSEWACYICMEIRRKKHREARPGGKALCVFDCGTMLDKLELGTYQYCTGWVTGNRGTGGKQGTSRNSISIPERQDRFACDDCIKRQMKGISLDQEQLF